MKAYINQLESELKHYDLNEDLYHPKESTETEAGLQTGTVSARPPTGKFATQPQTDRAMQPDGIGAAPSTGEEQT